MRRAWIEIPVRRGLKPRGIQAALTGQYRPGDCVSRYKNIDPSVVRGRMVRYNVGLRRGDPFAGKYSPFSERGISLPLGLGHSVARRRER